MCVKDQTAEWKSLHNCTTLQRILVTSGLGTVPWALEAATVWTKTHQISRTTAQGPVGLSGPGTGQLLLRLQPAV